MSTRANIVLKDTHGEQLWFYRHSDGYPAGTMPTLKKFIQLVLDGKIRDNASQAGGWLVIIGHEEYKKYRSDWKVGAYEPTTGKHGDIEYLYTISLNDQTVIIKGNGIKYLKYSFEDALKTEF